MFTAQLNGRFGNGNGGIKSFETLPGQDQSNTSFLTLGSDVNGWGYWPDNGYSVAFLAGYQPGGNSNLAGKWASLIGPNGEFAKSVITYEGSYVAFQGWSTGSFAFPGGNPMVGEWQLIVTDEEPQPPENDEYSGNLRVILFDNDNAVVDEENFTVNPESDSWENFYQVYDVLNEFVPIRKVVLRTTDGKAIRPGNYSVYFNPVASVITGLAGPQILLGTSVVPNDNVSIYAPVLAGSWLPLNAKYVNVVYDGPDQSTLNPPDSGGETETDPGEVDWTEPEDVAENPKPDTPKLKPEPIPPDPAICACSPWYKSIADQIMNVAEQLKWSNDNAREVQDKALSFFYKELVKIREELEKLNEKVDEGKFEPLTVVENNAISLDDEMEISTGEDEV